MLDIFFWKENESFVDDGVQLEPFNLEREREEGYFDEAGNFVEYVPEKEEKVCYLLLSTCFSDFCNNVMWLFLNACITICRMHGLIASKCTQSLLIKSPLFQIAMMKSKRCLLMTLER